ncbi:hypothetical protein [Streptomyces sp. NPDC090445]|uniref:hypothetical protein n=1 Tax=Streptomyces sp. NPDC090445 TaxID=3365963 RepID=UPI0038231085
MELLARCREESIEPSTAGRCDRIVGAALRAAEESLTALISTVHRIGARAEKKVTEQLINAFKKASGKENILFKLAEASLGTPEGTVRQVVFPAVSGGEATLRELVHEFKTRGPVYRRTVQTTLKASYTKPLPARVDQAAGRAGVPFLPPCSPAGDRGFGAGGPVRERGEHGVLPAGRDGAGPQGDGRGLGGGRPPDRQAQPAPGGAR